MYERRIMPFYMAYPMPMFGQQENTVMRDLEYMQQMYPKEAKRYQKLIAGILDKMDYEGSMIYDEYPDRLQLRLMCRRIYDKAEKEEENPGAWLMDLIEVMTYQELCRRRVEHREIRKKIY